MANNERDLEHEDKQLGREESKAAAKPVEHVTLADVLADWCETCVAMRLPDVERLLGESSIRQAYWIGHGDGAKSTHAAMMRGLEGLD